MNQFEPLLPREQSFGKAAVRLLHNVMYSRVKRFTDLFCSDCMIFVDLPAIIWPTTPSLILYKNVVCSISANVT